MGTLLPGMALPRPLAPHWERLRGVVQGRCTPALPGLAAGARCFVLGEADPQEILTLTPGDWTEVRQVVDLTDYDLLAATLHTVGQWAGTYRRAPGWAAHPAELWRFDGDAPVPWLANRITPAGAPAGFSLHPQGTVEIGREEYTGAWTCCRIIPVDLYTEGCLRGTHAPPAAAPGTALSAYTLQVILYPALAAIPYSWGWDMPVVQYLDQIGGVQDGLRLDLLGTAGPGAQSWYPYVTHFAGGVSSGTACTPWTLAPPSAWCQLSLVYDAALGGGDRLRCYCNDVLVATAAAPPVCSPLVPPATGVLEIASGASWGAWDAVRLVQAALSPAEVAASWAAAQTPGPEQRARWLQQIRIDDAVYAERTLVPTEGRCWTDFVAPVRRLTGPHVVAFRLILAEEA
jgi:hypothetical protein